jgi:RNA polymerase sigma factor (sigma-70 family)
MSNLARSNFIRNLLVKYPCLSQTEETDLFIAYRAGDRRAANKIMLHHTRLAISLANRFAKASGSFDDAFSAACLGITRAIAKFDSNRGSRFVTTARFYAITEIIDFMDNSNAPVKIPASRKAHSILRNARAINDIIDRIDPQSVATVQKLADELGLSEGNFRATVAALSPGLSLDNGPLQGDAHFLDALYHQEPTQESSLLSNEQGNILDAAIATVLATQTPRNREIFGRRYLSEDQEMAMKIANDHNITANYVKTINDKIIGRIRAIMMSFDGDPALSAQPDEVTTHLPMRPTPQLSGF